MESKYYESGINVRSATEILDERKQLEEEKEKMEALVAAEIQPVYDSLSSHVMQRFGVNRDARRESGIEQDMIDDLYQVAGMYQQDELDNLSGANIFMNITATKQRAAKSWIKDIIMPANAPPFEIVTSNNEEVPASIKKMIVEAFKEDEARLSEEIELSAQKAREAQNPQPEEQPQEGQPAQPPPEPPKSALIAARQMKEINRLRRDIEESIVGEIHKAAQHDVRKLNRAIEDDLNEGDFDKYLDQFIDDFTTFPTAYMKGPIVTTKQKLTWVEGQAIQEEVTTFTDSRINALDAYPSPGAADVYDGDFIEHVRITPKALSEFAKLNETTGYKPAVIKDILRNEATGSPFWLSTDIEEDKARVEKRGSQTYSNVGIYHGLHYWGSVSAGMLREWGLEDIELAGREDWEHLEVEILLVGTKVIKCRINKDPLQRRPYYAASFHPRSGSIWGRSLPNLMKDHQGMCNAAACALADNMGMASGPQMAIMVDRLADDGDIEEQEPFKIWQFKSDPQGNGGKPVEYFIAPSNAKELLAVYDAFEAKADDVTGVPRYAYGNDQTGGAGQTAQGLSMLLESASKGIKSAIMNIAKGLIEPRVEFQAYLYLLDLKEKQDPFKYSGDVNVVVKAVENITIKAAQQQLRKELLQATSNPQDIKIMGMEGRGLMLREIFKDANFPEDVIPDRLDLKERQIRDDANEQKQIDAQAQAGDKSTEATKIQIEGQMAMHEKTVALQEKTLEVNAKEKADKAQIELAKIRQKEMEVDKQITQKMESDKTKASTTIGVELSKQDQKRYEIDKADSRGDSKAPEGGAK